MTDKPSDFSTISEASKWTSDLSEGQIRKLCAAGEIPSVRVGTARLIRVTAMLAFLEQRGASSPIK